MMKRLTAFTFLLALIGCGSREYSQPLTEPATVTNTIYTPATHGAGMGFSSGGHVVFTSVDTREVWGAVFQCQHGNFVVAGEDSYYRDLFLKLRVGQKVVVSYREILRINGDQRVLEGYDFLDAVPESK